MKARRMTDAQRRALHLSSHKGGATIVHARKAADKQVTNAMANKLQARGWATRASDTLLITKAGRAALAAPIPEDPAVYLHERDGLTTRRDQSVRDESEIIDPATLKTFWREESDRRRAAAQERRAFARDLKRSNPRAA